ncbi:potassium voltage-gated channel subfamily H member 8-like [Coregonus clupeaformis]|uniref:potassium voltage-gated channel subfamily H member 8-like n=1 Tax=Coregonus clupeaformis TaxID=59861 RepID=UPI001E1C8CCD|nr:potassium voltage-gated channel subfamily H member 8-like [Coregonus clupeaformis]
MCVPVCVPSHPPGKGDLIGSDSLTKKQVIKTNANVKALTYCDLQYISLKGLREVLRLYPEYAQKFISEIQHDLTYNLREGHGADVDWESNGSLVKKLSSIKEDEEGDEEQSSVSRAPRSPRRLTRVLNSPLRSPLLHPRPFRPPSEHTRPATLQIPVVSLSNAPPELSPRFVDGIETESSVNSSQKFEFSSSLLHSGQPSPGLGLQEKSEIKQSISKLSDEMSALSQQVSHLSQELKEITRLLRPLLLVAPQPILTAMTPILTPPPSSASQPSSNTPLVVPPPAPPCSPSPHLQRTQSCSLLDMDSADTGSVGLPSCLLPTPPPQRPPAQNQTQSPISPERSSKDLSNSNPPSPGTGDIEGSPHLSNHSNNHTTSSNGFLPSAQDRCTLASSTTSPSLSLSLSSSPSCSPCQGPHHLRSGSHSRCLLPPHPSQDNTPPPSSHCSAPPSISSSPGDHRLKLVCPSSSSTPLIPPLSCPYPSTLSLGPFTLDSLRGEKQGGPRLEGGHLELEMQEWGGERGERRSQMMEHISYIDEEGPAL